MSGRGLAALLTFLALAFVILGLASSAWFRGTGEEQAIHAGPRGVHRCWRESDGKRRSAALQPVTIAPQPSFLGLLVAAIAAFAAGLAGWRASPPPPI